MDAGWSAPRWVTLLLGGVVATGIYAAILYFGGNLAQLLLILPWEIPLIFLGEFVLKLSATSTESYEQVSYIASAFFWFAVGVIATALISNVRRGLMVGFVILLIAILIGACGALILLTVVRLIS